MAKHMKEGKEGKIVLQTRKQRPAMVVQPVVPATREVEGRTPT
jgi:hypothetical protein